MMMVVAFILLMTPAVYFLMTVGGAIAWILHLTLHANLLSEGIVGIVLYFVPAVTGPFVVIFMLRPFFIEPEPFRRPRIIKREAEPFLYEYVEALCESLNAPVPQEIRLNCDVNASASFSGGIWSLFSNRLTLTIGIPLFYGLTLPQLTGVLAHEFGHFSQRGGLRVSYFIRMVASWIGTAAFGPDPMVEWLAHQRRRSNLFVVLVCLGFSCGIWVARSVLACIALSTHAISSALVRQMEFDADLTEAKYVGSEGFVETTKRIPRLAVAEQFAFRDLAMLHNEGRLVDDFPQLIAASIDQIDKKIDKAVAQMQRERETKLFDTHPSDRERVRNARRMRSKPAFQVPDRLLRARSSVLLRDVGRVSRAATLELYKHALGAEFKKSELHPTDDILDRREIERKASAALSRFFRVDMPAMFPIPLVDSAAEPTEDPGATIRDLKRHRIRMAKELRGYKILLPHYEHAEHCQMDAGAACSLLSIGATIQGSMFGLSSSSPAAADERFRLGSTAVLNLSNRMLPFEDAAGGRLSCALQLIANESFRNAIGNSSEAENLGPLVKAALGTTDMMAQLRPIRLLCHRVSVVFASIRGNEENYEFVHTLINLVDSLAAALEQLYWDMGGFDYPFDHADEYATIQTYVLPKLPAKNDVGGMLYASQEAFARLATLQMRLFAHLTRAAELVERHLQLQPIPEPEQPQSVKKQRR